MRYFIQQEKFRSGSRSFVDIHVLVCLRVLGVPISSVYSIQISNEL
jgi:hypothetical protein